MSVPTMKVINTFCGPLEQWTYESCTAEIASKDDWATVYIIESREPSKGHATALLLAAKKHYESMGKRFGGSVALNDRMRSLYKHLGIVEYDDAYVEAELAKEKALNEPRPTIGSRANDSGA